MYVLEKTIEWVQFFSTREISSKFRWSSAFFCVSILFREMYVRTAMLTFWECCGRATEAAYMNLLSIDIKKPFSTFFTVYHGVVSVGFLQLLCRYKKISQHVKPPQEKCRSYLTQVIISRQAVTVHKKQDKFLEIYKDLIKRLHVVLSFVSGLTLSGHMYLKGQ